MSPYVLHAIKEDRYATTWNISGERMADLDSQGSEQPSFVICVTTECSAMFRSGKLGLKFWKKKKNLGPYLLLHLSYSK